MELTNQCHCCLQRPPAKDLCTPYTRFGITEIYSVMIEECFVINLTSCDDGKSGICEVCLGRLREACLFKLQVQHCQAELQMGFERKLSVKDEEALDELSSYGAYSDSPEPSLSSDEEPLGPSCKDEPRDEHLLLSLPGGEYRVGPEPLSSRVIQQLSLGCSVRLERLRDPAKPCPVTSHREPSPARSVQDEPGHTAAEEQACKSDVKSSIKPEPCDDDVGDEQLLDASFVKSPMKSEPNDAVGDEQLLDASSVAVEFPPAQPDARASRAELERRHASAPARATPVTSHEPTPATSVTSHEPTPATSVTSHEPTPATSNLPTKVLKQNSPQTT
ncbi:uncharacterized protein LOC134803582 [Cydia splendana]|uniref:uncharacterized protein LOC134803582 n=1 Tax=Cydia splendana TaxID=1100963 RepID=UPI00300C8043